MSLKDNWLKGYTIMLYISCLVCGIYLILNNLNSILSWTIGGALIGLGVSGFYWFFIYCGGKSEK